MRNVNIKIKAKSRHVDSTNEIFDYQQEAVCNLKKMDEAYTDYYSTLIVVPTGGGKTRIAVSYLLEYVLNHKKQKVLWIAERLLLLEQAYDAFKELADRSYLLHKEESEIITRLISSKHGKYEDADLNPEVDLVIITQQTLENKIDRNDKIIHDMRNWLQGAEGLTVIIDEAHHAIERPYRAILGSLMQLKNQGVFGRLKVIGLSATPKKEDSKDIEDIFSFGVMNGEATSHTSYAYQISISKLVATGVLSTPYIARIMGDEVIDKDELIVQTYCNGFEGIELYDGRSGKRISKNTAENHSFGSTIIFAESRTHALKLEKRFKMLGIECGLAISIKKGFEREFKKKENIDLEEFLEGKSVLEKSRQIREDLEKYKKGNLGLIITRDVLLEGVDFPKTQTIFIARDVMDVEVTQMVGRALRGIHQKGTPTAYIISFGKDQIEKILWEIPDSYHEQEGITEFKSDFELSRCAEIATVSLPEELSEGEFQHGVVLEADIRLVLGMKAEVENQQDSEEQYKAENRLIQNLIQNNAINQIKLIPVGYYSFSHMVILVWKDTEVWMREVIGRVEEIVNKCNITDDNLKSISYFEPLYNRISNTVISLKMINRQMENNNYLLSRKTVMVCMFYLFRFYKINCMEDSSTFRREMGLHNFHDLNQYDLSDYLVESAEYNLEQENVSEVIRHIWERDKEKLKGVWGNQKTFEEFLKPKIYQYHQIPLAEEQAELEEESEYFRVRLYREGRKRSNLCDMLKRILEYAPKKYVRFVDVFGGTGTITAQMYGLFEERIYNDFDPSLVNFMYCASRFDTFAEDSWTQLMALNLYENKDEMLEDGKLCISEKLCELGFSDDDLIRADETLQKKMTSIQANAEEKKGTKREYWNDELKKLKGENSNIHKSRELADRRQYLLKRYLELSKKLKILSNPDVKEQLKVYIALYYIANSEVDNRSRDGERCQEWRRRFNSNEFTANTGEAFRFIFSRSFPSYSVSGDSITGVDEEGIIKVRKAMDWKNGTSWLTEFYKRTEGVKIYCKDFMDVLHEYDEDEETIIYLDPPYFLTCQYDAIFPDEFHLRMLNWFRTTSSHWVLSCKDTTTNDAENKNIAERTLRGEFKTLIRCNYVDGGNKVRLEDYFKGFLFDMIEVEKRKIGDKDYSIYGADESNEVQKNTLYVYKLRKESKDEIMVSNIAVKEADKKVLLDAGIQMEEFKAFFHIK